MSWLMWCILLLLLIVLYVLYNTNKTFVYYVKFILFNITVMVLACICIPYSSMRPRDVNNIGFLCRMYRVIMPWLLKVKIEPRNHEHHKKISGPCVVVANHQSSIDTVPMLLHWPDRGAPLAKKELLYAGPFGLACWLSGTVFIDRLNPEKARDTMKKTSKIMHEKKIKLFVFPEGTRNHGVEMLPFKKGAFHLAVEAQVPIVPIVFSSYLPFMSKQKKIFEPGYIIASCLPPVPTEGLTKEDVTKLTENVQKLMMDEFTKISQEIPEKLKEHYGTTVSENFAENYKNAKTK